MAIDLSEAYEKCNEVSDNHYENFPVASVFLDKKLRKPIKAIYAFARLADDYADEGDFSKEVRYFKLNKLKQELLSIQLKKTYGLSPIMQALSDTIHTHNLPIDLFYDLLSAFMQDIRKNRYYNFDEVLNYCTKSANPIGRLLLKLTNNDTEENLYYSDKICTALQLINMLQDFKHDLEVQNRIYLPLDELNKFGLSYNDLLENNVDLSQYIKMWQQRVSKILLNGESLIPNVNGRLKIELKLIVSSANIILNKIAKDKNFISNKRLKRLDYIKVILGALTNGRRK